MWKSGYNIMSIDEMPNSELYSALQIPTVLQKQSKDIQLNRASTNTPIGCLSKNTQQKTNMYQSHVKNSF